MGTIPAPDLTPASKARDEAWRLLDDSKKTQDPRRRKEMLVRAFELAQLAEGASAPDGGERTRKR